MQNVSLSKLKKYGYTCPKHISFEKDNRTIYKKNLHGMSLNHSIIECADIEECDFDLAAITGSIYRHCTFTNNSMKEPDFEFCEFLDCDFYNKTPIICSYNNSNFINTRFHDISFDSCTFTSAYFEECHFIGGRIRYSTLENSYFKECIFENMDLRSLNMAFVELNNPHMSNVTLPLSQIPFMYGCLNYLLNTQDSVRISKGKKHTISIHEYFEKVIPLMENYFDESEQYFPLSNIYISLKKYDLATDALKKGLSMAIENRDFRMLKYYCYLIAKSGCFQSEQLHMFYNNICRLSPQGKGSLNEQKNYTRHIGEIKAILFDQTSGPNLTVTIRTDVHANKASKLSYILEALFAISKTDIGYGTNRVEALVTQNSPLTIELRVNGNESGLIYLLSALTKLLDTDSNVQALLPCIEEKNNNIDTFYEMANKYREKIKTCAISLVLMEYYFENFEKYHFDNIPRYYHNNIFNRTVPLLNS